MKIKLSEISTSSNRYEISDSSWFPDEEIKRSAPLLAEIVLTKKSNNKVELAGRLQTRVELSCDRCLALFFFDIDVVFHLIVQYQDDGSWKLQDMECSKSDLDTVTIQEPVIDLGDVLRQQLFLALPDKSLCKESCRGLCSRCGADLNKAPCDCDKINSDSPFAVLSTLKK